MKVIKILALKANPTNTAALRLDKEVREIKAVLDQATYRDRFEFISEGAVRVEDLSRAMLKHKPDIVHFSGHGAGENGLVLENDAGAMQLVSTEALSQLFKWGRATTKCVVLNACYSKVQAEAIHQNIDCVIGMNKAVNDQAAIQFAVKFYQALMDGEGFQSAYDYACTALALLANKDASTPELLNRTEGADPLKIITAPEAQQSQVAEPAQPHAQQSQTVGNVTMSGSGNFANALQAGGDISLNQSSQQASSNPDLQAALAALAKLKQDVTAADTLSTFAKRQTGSTIDTIQEELQKPKPDKSFVNEAVDALKQGLSGVVTLAEPVTEVAGLLAKAWVGLL